MVHRFVLSQLTRAIKNFNFNQWLQAFHVYVGVYTHRLVLVLVLHMLMYRRLIHNRMRPNWLIMIIKNPAALIISKLVLQLIRTSRNICMANTVPKVIILGLSFVKRFRHV